MTESRHKEIVEFTQTLGVKRQQVSDKGLLDQAQQALIDLLELSKDDALEPDPAPVEAEMPKADDQGRV